MYGPADKRGCRSVHRNIRPKSSPPSNTPSNTHPTTLSVTEPRRTPNHAHPNMEESFFFALLRISVAQMLKASGFDKCKPSVLDMVTDLYIRHLELVVHKAQTFSVARTSSVNNIEPQDVMEALLNIGLLRPSSPQDPLNKKNTKSLDSWVNWVKYSDGHAVSRRLNAVPTSVLANLIEKRKIDTSSETDQERKKRRLRERQEYFNQLKQGDESAKQDKHTDLADDLDDDELTPNDKLSWLAYLAEKDMKLGQNMKFVNTCIQDDLIHVHKLKKFHPTPADGEDSYVQFKHQMHTVNRNDHMLIQVQDDDNDKSAHAILPSPELKGVLPYNVKYDETLTDDDMQQYLAYASTHEDEIRERLLLLEDTNTGVSEQGGESTIDQTKGGDAVENEESVHKKENEEGVRMKENAKGLQGDAPTEPRKDITEETTGAADEQDNGGSHEQEKSGDAADDNDNGNVGSDDGEDVNNKAAGDSQHISGEDSEPSVKESGDSETGKSSSSDSQVPSEPAKATSDGVHPKETGEDVPPKESGEDVPPKETGENAPPKETGGNSPPKETGGNSPLKHAEENKQ
ncbi:hypothetical protein JCM33374_g6106 [Metschnikowia sp. JCM 33374]|nr:hypothetical protein JCM33374_g6106 [Metschnikowia sp. JCM 33374]